MRIIGCDLHARQQMVAMLDTKTEEVVKMTLTHEGDNVPEFYSSLPHPIRMGIEATGSMQWFVNLMEELGIECRVGHPAEIRAAEPRKQKHDRQDADLILKLLMEKPLSGDLAAFAGATRSTGLIAAPSSVGTHADANTKRAAVDCFGEWSTTRPLSVESSRPTGDRVVAVETTYRLSAERVTGDVREVRGGDRETEPSESSNKLTNVPERDC
jgi:transposase